MTEYCSVSNMEHFRKDGIVHDVIDNAPPAILKVQYGGTEISPGVAKKPTEVKDKPTVVIEQNPGEYHTLLFHDPDAPSRKDPKNGEYQHWVVMNITGNDIKTGDELTAYIGAGPPKGTGLHRYAFLLFKQNKGKLDTSGLPRIPYNSGQGRAKQKVRDIAKRFGLELVAGNFFQAEWDEYVPKLHEQLRGGK